MSWPKKMLKFLLSYRVCLFAPLTGDPGQLQQRDSSDLLQRAHHGLTMTNTVSPKATCTHWNRDSPWTAFCQMMNTACTSFISCSTHSNYILPAGNQCRSLALEPFSSPPECKRDILTNNREALILRNNYANTGGRAAVWAVIQVTSICVTSSDL